MLRFQKHRPTPANEAGVAGRVRLSLRLDDSLLTVGKFIAHVQGPPVEDLDHRSTADPRSFRYCTPPERCAVR